MRLFKYLSVLILFVLIYLYIPRESDRLLYFPKKENRYFCNYLTKQKLPINFVDCAILKFIDTKEGWIRSSGVLNKIDIYKMALSKKIKKLRVIPVYSGDNIDTLAQKISKQTSIDKNKLLATYKKLAKFKDGAIVAKKYKIPYNATANSIMAYMLSSSEELFKSFGDIDSKEFKDKLIIASIIQKETHNKKEMPIVASVIYNRLKKNMKLQMDATLNYKEFSNKIVTPQRIKNDKSRYNTYKHKGLIPQPLCMVGIDALKAAFSPAKTDFLYFVKSKNSHKFSKKYATHQKEVRAYKRSLYRNKTLKVLREGITLNLPMPIYLPLILPFDDTFKLK